MNEDYKKIYLSDCPKEELSKLTVDQVQQLYLETLKEIVEVSQSATRHINQLDEYRKRAEQSGDEKTASTLGQVIELSKSRLADSLIACKSIVKEIKIEDTKTLSTFNQSTSDRERSFVETMSSGARAHDEHIQARRDERYEEMIEEAGEIESPASRLQN